MSRLKVINIENSNIPSGIKNDYPIEETCSGYHTSDYFICEESIPSGYFSNDDNEKLLYKCHDFCETCNKESTDINNNCLTCKDTKYLDLGNCVSEVVEHLMTQIIIQLKDVNVQLLNVYIVQLKALKIMVSA